MYDSKIRNESTEKLVKAILSLENEEECFRFLEDLCTYKEVLELAQRLEVASMLLKKETYNDIVKQTGISTATISRVNRAMVYGSNGYKPILDRIENSESAETEK